MKTALSQGGLGYEFLPPSTHEHPQYNQLVVHLRPHPTERHYDPEWISCMVATAEGDSESLTIHHPWPEPAPPRLVCGLIVLTDRKRKRVEALTFGGELSIVCQPDLTTCHFTSPAPILPLQEPHTVVGHLATEVQAVLAERQAAWDMKKQNDVFERRLAAVDPHTLYHALLIAISERLQPLAHHGYAPQQQLLHWVNQLRHAIEALNPHLPRLEDLL